MLNKERRVQASKEFYVGVCITGVNVCFLWDNIVKRDGCC